MNQKYNVNVNSLQDFLPPYPKFFSHDLLNAPLQFITSSLILQQLLKIILHFGCIVPFSSSFHLNQWTHILRKHFLTFCQNQSASIIHQLKGKKWYFTVVFGFIIFRNSILDLHLDNWSYEEGSLLGVVFLNFQLPVAALEHIHFFLPIIIFLITTRAIQRQRYDKMLTLRSLFLIKMNGPF